VTLPPEEVDVLVDLGLTSSQARVYLALCHCEKLEAKTISNYSGVPRQDIYRIASALQKRGLVEKIISRPIAFRAIPLEKGTAMLIERRKTKTKKLQLKVRKILEDFKIDKIEGEKTEFVLVPKKEAIIEKIRKLIVNSRSSIDLVTSWKMFLNTLSFTDLLEKAWRRGVKCRHIIEIPPNSSNPKPVLDFCNRSPFCEVKFVPSLPKTIFTIYDKKEVILFLKPKKELTESTALWSNNPNLVVALQDYYEFLWITALEEPKYSVDNPKI
jgi:sugar-specific transcriptional regulator TrmB